LPSTKGMDTTTDGYKEITYQSVAHARSLSDVMDNNIRGKVVQILNREFGSRSFAKTVEEKALISLALQKEIIEYCKQRGITVDYAGIATSLDFDKSIQDAINLEISSKYTAAATLALAPAIPIQRAQAEIANINATADMKRKWNGVVNMPSVLIASDRIMGFFSSMFGGDKPDSPKSK
jgi:hypothetical protein